MVFKTFREWNQSAGVGESLASTESAARCFPCQSCTKYETKVMIYSSIKACSSAVTDTVN